jgi:hypothetical protein
VKRPQIEAQRICDRIDADAVAMIAFGDGQVAGASYGVSKHTCAMVRKWLDYICDEMECGRLYAPPDFESTDNG